MRQPFAPGRAPPAAAPRPSAATAAAVTDAAAWRKPVEAIRGRAARRNFGERAANHARC
jgi:hypothetical protein